MWCKTFQLLLRIIGGVDYKVKILIFALISFFSRYTCLLGLHKIVKNANEFRERIQTSVGNLINRNEPYQFSDGSETILICRH